jgi:hypothetical protein
LLSTRAHLLKQILGVVEESLLVVDCTPTWVEQEQVELTLGQLSLSRLAPLLCLHR